MRFLFAFYICIVNFVSGFAQVNTSPNFIIKVVGKDTICVEQPPLKPGEKFVYIERFPQLKTKENPDTFIIRHLRYPEEERRKKIEGDVILAYLIKADGTIDSLKIYKGVSPGIDKEAIRLIKLLGGWIPGMNDGKEVDVWMTTRIPFRIRS